MAKQQVTEQQARKVAEEARQAEWTQPSFAKELFLGHLRLDLIHPHPRPSDDERIKGDAFLSKLEAFLSNEVDPLQIERDAKIPGHVIEGLREIGALGMEIAEEYGGLGLSHVYYNRALTMASSAHSALSTLLSAHQSIGVPQPLKLFGTEEQKRKFLPGLARDKISAFLLTEPDVGSDPARMGSTATPTEDGSEYVLTGTKLWTTNGVIADLLVVMADVPKSEGHRGGISAFVVEANSPGITVERRNEFMGLRGIENGLTRFDNVRIPAENLIAGEGRGLKIALQTLNTGRLSLPAICSASAKASLNIVREWSNERIQWGKPIGKHEAVAHKVAFIAGMAFAIEAVVELSSALADQERNDIRLEAALAKLYCSEMSWLVADEMVQIRGGRGYETAASLKARGERAVPAEQILRDLRITRIFEGSSEIMKLFIAREAVDQHLSVAGALIDPKAQTSAKARAALKAGGFYSTWFPQLMVGKSQQPGSYSEFADLAAHLRFVERTSRKLARSTFYGMSRWQGKLERKQGFLGRIVDVGAELYAMSAACVRARMLVEDSADDGASATELADLFCRGARHRIDRLFHDMWHNDDASNYDAAQKVLEGRYLWAELGILDLYGSGPMLGAEGKAATKEAAAAGS
ncbi:MAG: acyl-CoA dehydrogenase family protein [Candidatus Dormibacteraeota bacterium]|nr:acyl-CoA dehydrogenase family protein [Candidatus Dormibacteraeota bacterium]